VIIFLYGPDTYRLVKKTGEIIGEYKKRKSGQEFFVVDAQELPAKDFFSALRQSSLFQEKKFFVVKNPISEKAFKEALLDNMETLENFAHTLVFCQEGSVLKNDRLLTAFKKSGQIFDFPTLEADKAAAWAIKEFDSLGNAISRASADFLVGRCGDDMWRLANEIQKLGHRYPGKEITDQDIESNVAPEVDANIFQTVDAIAQRDKKQAIELVRRHISKGDHPLYLLAMIATQFKNLLLVKSCSESGGANMAQRLAIHPYVLRKTSQQAHRFGIGELKSVYRRISQTDRDVKTGKVSPETGLDLLIAQL
jgi:DNA polymerase-3 subunit delta